MICTKVLITLFHHLKFIGVLYYERKYFIADKLPA